MARLVELGGAPVNRAERDVVQRLVADLPKSWAVIPNVDIHDQRSGHPYECDAIVVGATGVWIVEVKGWRGRIQAVSGRQWQLDDGKYVDNPLVVTDLKARVLGTHMKRLRLEDGLRPPYVGAVLAVADPRASFDLFAEEEARCFHAHTISRGLGAGAGLVSRRHAGPAPYRTHIDRIVDHVTRRLQGREERMRAWGSYQAVSRVGGDEESTTWLARHTLLDDGRLYRVRTWFMSAYLFDERERAERLRVHKRAATALSRIGDHPNIAKLRAFGQQEGEFYEVTDWSEHGTLETAFVRGLLAKLDPQALARIVRGLANALRTMVDHGVYHRDLSPDSILLEPDGTPRVTDFDRAFVTATTGTVYGAAPLDANPYRPPELRNPADHEVFVSSDLWSLARICRDMIDVERLPPATQTILSSAAHKDPAERKVTPADLLATFDTAHADTPPAVQVADAAPPEPDPANLQVGDRVDQNRVIGELGRGANGVVYAVHNDVMQEDYALKVLLESDSAIDPLAGFRHARTVRCPHLRTVHWVGRVSDGRPYLLLDKLDGETLRRRLDRDGPTNLDIVLSWAEQLCEALTALHPTPKRPGVLHRDLKPDNVMLVARGAVLMDLSHAAPSDTAGDLPVGSPHYLPPDLSDGGWTSQADFFALGCILYEALAGVHPWGNQVPSLGRPYAVLSQHRADLPDAAVRLVHDLIAPQRINRPTTPAQILAAIAEVRQERVLANAAPIPRTTTLAQSSREASLALWSAGHMQDLIEAATLAVPLMRSMHQCLVVPTSEEPEDREEALLATEARLLALERPLPALSPRLYDRLLDASPLVPNDHDATEDPPDTSPGWPGNGLLLMLDGLHPVEWDTVEAAVRIRCTQRGSWQSGLLNPSADDEAEDAARGLLSGAPRALTVTSDRLANAYASGARALRLRLPAGRRSEVDLGDLMEMRHRMLSTAIDLLDLHPGPAWISATHGSLFLGHGLRVDVAEGLHQPGHIRGRWATAFGPRRVTDAPTLLPSPYDQPTRTRAGHTWVVGRLAWPDPPGTPWLAIDGLSLPERLLPVWALRPIDPAPPSESHAR